MDEEQCKSCLDEYTAYLPWFARGRTSEDVQKKKLSVSLHLLFKTKKQYTIRFMIHN